MLIGSEESLVAVSAFNCCHPMAFSIHVLRNRDGQICRKLLLDDRAPSIVFIIEDKTMVEFDILFSISKMQVEKSDDSAERNERKENG